MLSDTEYWKLLRQAFLPFRSGPYDLASVCHLTRDGCVFSPTGDFGNNNVADLRRMEAPLAGEGARFGRPGNDAFWQHPLLNIQRVGAL